MIKIYKANCSDLSHQHNRNKEQLLLILMVLILLVQIKLYQYDIGVYLWVLTLYYLLILEKMDLNFALIIFIKSLPSSTTEMAKADSAEISVIEDIDNASVVVKCKNGIIINTKIYGIYEYVKRVMPR